MLYRTIQNINAMIKIPNNLTPTEKQFTALNRAYLYFNEALFYDSLPGCILTFSRKRNTHGFMSPEQWRRKGEQFCTVHEISLTPKTLSQKPIEVFGTLVHEMVHLWQWEYGNPSRCGYHNKEWALKMKEIGLIPSATGLPGGKQTGQRMSHYIKRGGRYEKAFQKIPKEFLLPFVTGAKRETQLPKKYQKTKNRNKIKYTCWKCRTNVWGKPNLKLRCEECNEAFEVKPFLSMEAN